ncbi:MAG: ArsR family transcriptional regulator [Rhizobacter sp.]|nr:ArsR family transcriptional regulator [Bacteriovorax sp.]
MNHNDAIVEPEILKELSSFEIFFGRMGFKRIDGSVFGLLILAKKPLTSEEIEQTLNLSQSAVSLSLKTLTHFGAVETTGDRDNRDTKARLHSAKEDSLSIVASVFRKREEEVVADFKRMAIRVLEKSESAEHLGRKKRMQSILTTCEIAESVMNFVITMAHSKSRSDYDAQYEAMVKRLPKALDLLATTAGPLADFTMNIKDNLTEKFKSNFKGIL